MWKKHTSEQAWKHFWLRFEPSGKLASSIFVSRGVLGGLESFGSSFVVVPAVVVFIVVVLVVVVVVVVVVDEVAAALGILANSEQRVGVKKC